MKSKKGQSFWGLFIFVIIMLVLITGMFIFLSRDEGVFRKSDKDFLTGRYNFDCLENLAGEQCIDDLGTHEISYNFIGENINLNILVECNLLADMGSFERLDRQEECRI